MNRRIAICLTLFLSSVSPLLAQETVGSPGAVEVTLTPAGGTFFTSGSEADFGNYTYGGALTINLNRVVGLEGDLAGSNGIAQDLEFGNTTMNAKSPNTFMYFGDVVVSVPTGHAVVPYVAAGAGGLTMFERAAVHVRDTQTFFGGDIGGGLKWYAPNRRWGVRADYRFVAIASNDDAPAFFGRENEYGHRVQIGVVINAMR